jgi:hypothetical protein
MSAGFRFESSTSQGAALILKHGAARCDIISQSNLVIDYIRQHVDSWYEFADHLQLDLEDGSIFMVRGCDKTTAWAVAAFSGISRAISFEFHGGYIPLMGVGLSLAGKWANMGSVEHRSGPPPPPIDTWQERNVTPQVEESSPRSSPAMAHMQPSNPPNQTVFLRIWKAKRRRFRAPRRIRAAAGPRNEDRDSRSPRAFPVNLISSELENSLEASDDHSSNSSESLSDSENKVLHCHQLEYLKGLFHLLR